MVSLFIISYKSGLNILTGGQAGEAWLLVFMVFLLLVLTAPKPVAYQSGSQQSAWYIYNAWYGALPLWETFWPFLILSQLVFILTDSLISVGRIPAFIWDISMIILFLSGIWWIVSTWRCSPNTRRAIWAASARLISVALILVFLYRLNLRVYQPRYLFSCDEMLSNYFSCF